MLGTILPFILPMKVWVNFWLTLIVMKVIKCQIKFVKTYSTICACIMVLHIEVKLLLKYISDLYFSWNGTFKRCFSIL